MERNMIGKNAWGLSIRPCDKGYEFTVECGLIERINKTMDKAKIKGQAFPATGSPSCLCPTRLRGWEAVSVSVTPQGQEEVEERSPRAPIFC